MGLEIEINGARQLKELSARLEQVAQRGLTDALAKELQAAVPELKLAVREGALTKLPKSGGLAELVASAGITARIRSGRNPSIRLIAVPPKGIKDIRAIDRGRVRHPTYGHRPWPIQLVPPGFFSKSLADQMPALRSRLSKALGDILKRR